VAGPTREVYLNDPKEVPPDELLTEIYAPVA
jgi:AraC family transcriptional regulator